MLDWTIYITFGGTLLLMFLPARNLALLRGMALLITLAGLVCGILGYLKFDPTGGLLQIKKLSWIPTLGAQFFIAADGISITLVLLTVIAAVAGVLFS